MADFIDRYDLKCALQDMAYGHISDVYFDDNWVAKDHGAYVEVSVRTKDGHDSVDVYMENGRIVRMEPHRHNTVITKSWRR